MWMAWRWGRVINMSSANATLPTIREMGAIESVIKTPAFSRFWEGTVIQSLKEFRTNIQRKAQQAARAGRINESAMLTARAACVDDILTKLDGCLDRAIQQEQEKKYGKRANKGPEQEPGYSTSGL